MKKQRKKFSRPLKPYDKGRIENEHKISQKYGLRRKREIWKAEAILREFRERARNLAARRNKEEEHLLLDKLHKFGLIPKNSNLDDVLSLTLDKLLDRRLQTIVHSKGLAHTPKQARQFIVHGHIAINGRRTRWPSQLVMTDQESEVNFYSTSNVGEMIRKAKAEEVKKEKEKVKPDEGKKTDEKTDGAEKAAPAEEKTGEAKA